MKRGKLAGRAGRKGFLNSEKFITGFLIFAIALVAFLTIQSYDMSFTGRAGHDPPLASPFAFGPACEGDTITCPDGSVVGRDPNNNCQFYECPFGSAQNCQIKTITCPNGEVLSYNTCFTPQSEIPVCSDPSSSGASGSSGGFGVSSSGESINGQSLTILSPSVVFSNTQVSARLAGEGAREIISNEDIFIEEPEPVSAKSNQLSQWKTNVRVNKRADKTKIMITIPNAKYVRTRGPGEVSIEPRTISPGLFEGFSSASKDIQETDITIEPLEGVYEISYFTNPITISSEEELPNNGKRVVVTNSLDIDYDSASVLVKMRALKENEYFIVRGLADGKIYELKVLVSDFTDENIVKFVISAPANSEQMFDIIRESFDSEEPGEEDKVVVSDLESEIADEKISLTSSFLLTDECEASLKCEESLCEPPKSAGRMFFADGFSGVKESVCRSDNPDCPSVVRKVESCSFGKEISFSKEEKDILPFVSQIESAESMKVSSLAIFDKEKNTREAVILFASGSRGEKYLDIIFR